MQVSPGIQSEAVLLGISILVGAGLFLVYDCLRIFRRIVKHGAVWIGFEDFLYWLLCTVVVFIMLYQENDGMIRGFALGGVIIGMLLYYIMLSRFIIHINVLVLKTVLTFLKKLGKFIFGPVYRIGKKILAFSVKQLKKVRKAIKIGLYKL